MVGLFDYDNDNDNDNVPGISVTTSVPIAPGSGHELAFQQIIDLLRVGLALALFHDLADEEAEHLVVAGAVLGYLVGVGGDDGVDQ